MIFRLDDELFRPGLFDVLEVGALVDLARDGRHVVLTRHRPRDPQAVLLNAWLEDNGNVGRRQRELLDNSFRRAHFLGRQQRVQVTILAHSSWSPGPPEVSLRDALDLGRGPLHLLVESRHSDIRFLRCASPGTLREALNDALDRKWIEPEHGGGIPTMITRVKELASAEAERLRTFALSDRDCFLWDATPSEKAKELATACDEAKVPYQMLDRNESENYLPLRALQHWAEQPGGPKAVAVKRENVLALQDVPAHAQRFVDYKAALSSNLGLLFADKAVHPHYAAWVRHEEQSWPPQLQQQVELDGLARRILERL